MMNFTLRDYLDLEAVVDNEEDVEMSEEELDEFFDEDLEETERGVSEGPVFLPDDRLSTTDASELEARVRDVAGTSRRARRYGGNVVPQHLLVPTVNDPELWAIRVKVGCESSLVLQILRRCILGLHRLDIASVLARDGIPGYIFLEGSYLAARQAVAGLVTVLSPAPRLIPVEQRTVLLNSCNPLTRIIDEGQWVRCRYGLYRDDIGFVCGRRESHDLEIIVALVPRIPNRSDKPVAGRAGKRKRPSRPLPRPWSSVQVATEWGDAKVQSMSSEKFTFLGETYESALIMKHFAPDSLVIVGSPPSNFESFLAASSIRKRPSFAPWLHCFAQDSLQPQQRVRVESGDLTGLIGRPYEIIDAVAFIVPESAQHGILVVIEVPLRSLAPHYLPGDGVKARWSDSFGIVMSVDEVHKTLVYVELDPTREITTSMDCVEFYEPPRRLTQIRVSTWVELDQRDELRDRKRRGVVKQFTINPEELDISGMQGPSLPKNDPIHPLVGRCVRVVRGNFKGYYALVKHVGRDHVTVEIEAHLVSRSSAQQHVSWTDLVIVPKTGEPSRFPPPLRPRTPPIAAAVESTRSLTPDPEASQQGKLFNFATPSLRGSLRVNISALDHWLLSITIYPFLLSNRIPFYIRDIRGSGDGSMDIYEGKTAWTAPQTEWHSLPAEGEVVVTVVVRSTKRPQMISIKPKFLVPWEPEKGCDVVVISGSWFGCAGRTVAKDDDVFIVRFRVENDLRDERFVGKQLAVLEPVRESNRK